MGKSIDKRLVVAVLIALALLGWFLAGVDWKAVADALWDVSPGWFLLASAILLFEYTVRGARWYFLLGDVDPGTRMRDLISATHVGAAFNTFLPLRGGDIVRIAMLSHKRGIPFATVLSTTVVERVLDAFGFAGSMVVLLLLLPPDLGGDTTVAQYRAVGLWIGVGAMAGLFGLILLGTRGARNTVVWMARPLPTRMRRRLLQGWRQMVIGLRVVGSPVRLFSALALTVAVYAVGYVGMICVFRAFDLDLPDVAALFVSVAMHVSVALPQAPGFLGVFQVVTEQVFALWGATRGEAQAMALVLWVVFFVPVTVVGTFAAWREGTGLRGFRRQLVASVGAAAPPADER